MTVSNYLHRPTCLILGADAIVFGALCLLALYSGFFHLRLLFEAFAASYLVMLTVRLVVKLPDCPLLLATLVAAIVAGSEFFTWRPTALPPVLHFRILIRTWRNAPLISALGICPI